MLLVLALIGYGFVFVAGTLTLLDAFRLYRRTQHPPSRARIGLISMSLLLLLSCVGVVVLMLTPFALIETKRVGPLLVLFYVTMTLINLINDWTSLRENYRKFPRVRAGTLLGALLISAKKIKDVARMADDRRYEHKNYASSQIGAKPDACAHGNCMKQDGNNGILPKPSG